MFEKLSLFLKIFWLSKNRIKIKVRITIKPNLQYQSFSWFKTLSVSLLKDAAVGVVLGGHRLSEPVHHLIVELFLSSELLAEGLDLATALLDRVVRPGKQLPVRVLRVDLLPHLNSHDWHHFINFGAFVLIFLRLSKRHLFVLRGCINNLRAFFVVIARVIHGDGFLNGLLGRFKEPFSLSFNLLLQRSRLAQLVDDELVKELVSAILLVQILRLVLVPWLASQLENLERRVCQSGL